MKNYETSFFFFFKKNLKGFLHKNQKKKKNYSFVYMVFDMENQETMGLYLEKSFWCGKHENMGFSI